jgi:hypothetical protein
MIYEQLRRYDDAAAALARAEALDTESAPYLALRCRLQAVRGNTPAARSLLERLEAIRVGYPDPFWKGLCHAALGENSQALAMLERAADEGSGNASLLHVDPKFDSLRTEPRFRRLLARLNLGS